jgi:pSer/pThr/pTyr-binding forkhead associated (FHA) protein
MSNNKFRLVSIINGVRGKEFLLKEGVSLIGRNDPNTGNFPDIDLEQLDSDAKVSRKHAQIICADDQLKIEDLNSLNGTFVNRGEKLRAGIQTSIKPGDELVFGKVFLLLEQF